jgi:hypothetical protein
MEDQEMRDFSSLIPRFPFRRGSRVLVLAALLALLTAGAGVLTPSPGFAWIVCTSNTDCPTGQLCCYPCGIDGCDKICMDPWNKRCPLIP